MLLTSQTPIKKLTKAFLKLLIGCLSVFLIQVGYGQTQALLTVKEAEFRNRWTGQQEDREVMPQYFLSDGGLSEKKTTDESQDDSTSSKSWVDSIDAAARDIHSGMRFGPVDFSLGLNTGWQYSSQNSLGESNDSSSSTSLFAATSLGANYDREIGLWKVDLGYSVGYTYFFNPDYTAAGQDNQRNPLAMTGSLGVGYNTGRLSMNWNTSASSGNGYDIVTGTNNVQTNVSTSLSGQYTFSETVSAGSTVAVNYSKSADAQVPEGEAAQPESNSITSSASVFTDYLLSPKTNVRFVLSAGQDLQQLQFSGSQGRRYFDSMLQFSYQLAPKFSVSAGAGAGYVVDQDIADPAYAGLRPVYNLSVNYTPTEKTFFKLNFGMQGADIRPNFSLVGGWNAREKTRLTASIYQNQGFSSLSPDQYNITRGFLTTISQRLIKGFDLSLSGGWEQSLYVGLSQNTESAAIQGPADYFLTNASLNWRIREWLGWQNSCMVTTGQGNSNQLSTTISSSFNLTF